MSYIIKVSYFVASVQSKDVKSKCNPILAQKNPGMDVVMTQSYMNYFM